MRRRLISRKAGWHNGIRNLLSIHEEDTYILPGTVRRRNTTMCSGQQVTPNGVPLFADGLYTADRTRDIPSQPALSVPTPQPTPIGLDPFGKPIDTNPVEHAEGTGESDRGFLGVSRLSVIAL